MGECGLWSLPDPDLRSGSASERCDRLPACVRVSEVVLDGLLGGLIGIMPVRHLNTEGGAALTVNVRYWFHTGLCVGPQGRWVREEDALCGQGPGTAGGGGLRGGSPGWCRGRSPEQPCWHPEGREPLPQADTGV